VIGWLSIVAGASDGWAAAWLRRLTKQDKATSICRDISASVLMDPAHERAILTSCEGGRSIGVATIRYNPEDKVIALRNETHPCQVRGSACSHDNSWLLTDDSLHQRTMGEKWHCFQATQFGKTPLRCAGGIFFSSGRNACHHHSSARGSIIGPHIMQLLNLSIVVTVFCGWCTIGLTQEIGDPSGLYDAYPLERLPDIDPQVFSNEVPWTMPPPPSTAFSGPKSWYQPWFAAQAWDTSFELGINGASGNADSFSLNAGAKVKHETERLTNQLAFSYARTTANSVTTQDIFMQDARSDWNFGESPFSLFFNENLMRDKLRDFDWRLALNAGLGYQIIDTEWTKWKVRFGAGTSREIGGLDDRWVPEAVFGTDYEHKLSDRQKLTAVVDYYPEWGNFASYRIVGRAGWEIILDDDPNLSLKLELLDRYDSTPGAGVRPNDLNYSLLFILKL
jgi:hypothetical protein